LKRMRERDDRVWIATDASRVGFDMPDVRVVIHIGLKSKSRDQIQESGRGGRDGMRSEGIVMRAVQRFSREVIGIGERWIEEEMKECVRKDVCRRRVINREMDRRSDRFGCDVGEQKCDVCQGRAKGEKRGRMVVWKNKEDLRARQVRRVDEKEVQRERALHDWSNDSIEEEEEEDNQDRVKVWNDDRVRV